MEFTKVSYSGSEIISLPLAWTSATNFSLGLSPLLYVGSQVAIIGFALTRSQRPLKIDELKHALALHHEIEGDTLLFEYAEKDIELVCGSLVTVRQGTLQVIHLTVKEFLTAPHEPKSSTYCDLLIDPAKASLSLTLACLECIRAGCNKSIVRLDSETARLDFTLDVEAVTQRQHQAPLVEYASLTWMMHLTECDGAQMIGVSEAFQKTFDSPSTFYWVEACMAFQPDCVLNLLLGLEEVIDHVSGLGLNHWSESEASCVFFTCWCDALRNVFEEHASTLSHRPWEVHFLDLQSSFSSMNQFYKRFGDTFRRDTTLRIDGYKSPRSCRLESQAHTRLQQDVKAGSSYRTSIFFIHDERRRLYIWGDTVVDLSNVRLFVQNATTGQRLPPVVRLHGEAGRKGFLSSYGLSPSGEYVVVVYGSKLFTLYVTMIWQISEKLTFKRRLRSEPWARFISSHECETEMFQPTTGNVVFTDGGYCLTPSGGIHLASGSRRPLLDGLPGRFVLSESEFMGSFYSQNGNYLFIDEMIDHKVFQTTRIAIFTENSEHLCFGRDSRRFLKDVSPSGRYLVLSGDYTSNTGEEFLHLYDVHRSETIRLPFFERMHYASAKYQFMKDETELIVFIMGNFDRIFPMTVSVWSDLQSDPSLKSYSTFKTDYRIEPSQIHVNMNESTALMVSKNRVIQRVQLRPCVKFPDAPDWNDDYPYTISQVSKDGGRWALLRYGETKAQLQMTKISYAKGPIQKLDLELSPRNEPYAPVATFSPDLSVLVIDAQIFSIAQGIHSLTSKSFTIQGLLELLVRYRARINAYRQDLLRCLISPCNSYIIFIGEGDLDIREAAPPMIYAFRVDLLSRSSTRLDLNLPTDLTYISANFHPSQQLMLLSYSSLLEYDLQFLELRSSLRIFVVELESLEMKPIGLPNGNLFMKRLKEYENGFAKFGSIKSNTI